MEPFDTIRTEHKVYYNQKIISKAKNDVNSALFTANAKNFRLAAKNLADSEFKVFCYFISNAENYPQIVYPKNIAAEMGMHERTVQDAINSLIDKKYIIQADCNGYFLYDLPQNDPKTAKIAKKAAESVQSVAKTTKLDIKPLSTDKIIQQIIKSLPQDLSAVIEFPMKNLETDDEKYEWFTAEKYTKHFNQGQNDVIRSTVAEILHLYCAKETN